MAPTRTTPSSEPEWRSAVRLREDAELTRLLAARLAPAGSPRSVSVTDLLAPRRAYWRASGAAVPPSPEREQRLEGGRRLHRALGVVLGASGALEVRVRGEGVHGRVDVLADRPIEVKTTGSALPGEDLPRTRGDHVDQLGMYCALLGRADGRLLYLRLEHARVGGVVAYDMRFEDLGAIRATMADRTARLRRALTERAPAGLGRCSWFGRGCEYQQAAACDCRGDEPEDGPIAADRAGPVLARPDLAEALERAAAALPLAEALPLIERFRDLLYPRHAFFRRQLGVPSPRAPPPPLPDDSDLYRRLTDAVESGPVGEVTRLPTRSDEPDEEVGGLSGVPYLVRTSRVRARVPPAEWISRSPQYALELGLRCVATGTNRARLIVGYERATREAARVQAIELEFEPASTFSRVWRARAGALADALARRDPGGLPACPGWMYERCDYREFCGCGSPDGRVQWKSTVEAVREKPSDS